MFGEIVRRVYVIKYNVFFVEKRARVTENQMRKLSHANANAHELTARRLEALCHGIVGWRLMIL